MIAHALRRATRFSGMIEPMLDQGGRRRRIHHDRNS